MSTFQSGCIRAVSSHSRSLDELLHGHFDLVLLSPSWDSRCVPMTKVASVEATHGLILELNKQDEVGLRRTHDREIESFAKERCKHRVAIRGSSLSLSETWAELWAEV